MAVVFSKDEIAARIAKLQHLLVARGVDLAIFEYNTDIFYYSNSALPLYVLVPAAGQAVALARKAVGRIEEGAALPVYAFAGTKDLQAILAQTGVHEAKTVGFSLETASYATVQRMLKLFPDAEAVDLSWDIRTLRMVKSPAEISVFTRAGEIMAQVPQLLREHFRPGMTELELSAALEYHLRLAGHGLLVRCRREGVEMAAMGVCAAGTQTLAGTKFDGICGGAGLSAPVPYSAADVPIPQGAPIIVDFAFVLDGYHLDQTRMACWGRPPAVVTKAYADMLAIQHAIFAQLRPGARWDDQYTLAVGMAAEMGYADVFMGVGRDQVKFVGHGVGLELDEPPFLAPKMPYTLEAGMVLAIEPKVALPGIGVVGIEDTVVVREHGVERVTVAEQEMVEVG